MSSVLTQPKLDVSASTRLPPDWLEAIKSSGKSRSDWIREAIKQKLIDENLLDLDESHFSHKSECIPTYTLNTLYTSKNANVFKSLFSFFIKTQAQKKTDGRRSFFAHSSQG